VPIGGTKILPSVTVPDCGEGCLYLGAPVIIVGVTAASTLLGTLVGAASGGREHFVVDSRTR
jgi:hypothetical protein